MKYIIKTILKGAFPSGEDTEVYEVDEWVYDVIVETCLTHGKKVSK